MISIENETNFCQYCRAPTNTERRFHISCFNAVINSELLHEIRFYYRKRKDQWTQFKYELLKNFHTRWLNPYRCSWKNCTTIAKYIYNKNRYCGYHRERFVEAKLEIIAKELKKKFITQLPDKVVAYNTLSYCSKRQLIGIDEKCHSKIQNQMYYGIGIRCSNVKCGKFTNRGNLIYHHSLEKKLNLRIDHYRRSTFCSEKCYSIQYNH